MAEQVGPLGSGRSRSHMRYLLKLSSDAYSNTTVRCLMTANLQSAEPNDGEVCEYEVGRAKQPSCERKRAMRCKKPKYSVQYIKRI